MNTLIDTVGASYFQRACLEAFFVGAGAGALGVYVLFRRLSFYVAALSHAILPGVVIASALGLSTFIGGWVFGLVVATTLLAVGAVGGRSEREVSNVGVVLTGAFAFGVLLLTAGAGNRSRDLTAFLVGSILTVDRGDITVSAAIAVMIAVGLLVFEKELLLATFDREGAKALGLRVKLIDTALLFSVTTVVVTVLPAVGTLLAVALLTVPALTARLWCRRTRSMMLVAGAIGAIGALLGLAASALWSIAAGGAIVLTLATIYLVAVALRALLSRKDSVPRFVRV